MNTLVFVYGTLRKGQHNHGMLASARFVAEVKTAAIYTLISLGGCPGLLKDGHAAVTGELYLVDAHTLQRLDRLEGHPKFYERMGITIDGHEEAVAYFLPRDKYEREDVITSGDWIEFAATRRW
jgi:gamma-glutamylaminecyclotransferase